jgi:hypothetical protein
LDDWDADSARLRANLARTLTSALRHAQDRRPPTPDLARAWHAEILKGLVVPNPAYIGAFRGDRGLERTRVRVAECWGVEPSAVAGAVKAFIDDLQDILARLDPEIPAGGLPGTGDALEAVLTTAALAHARWIKIHPFANGNGRTARLWANWVLMRYGIPPFVRLRPRPEGHDYFEAARRALCEGDFEPTIALFLRLFDEPGA